jgi:hypothetical protein
MASFGLGGSAPANQEPIEPSTPWVAAADGKLELLQSSLCVLNLPPCAKDENGYTLLQAAASYGKLQVLQWLLSQNVDVNAVDNEGDTAIHYAGCLDAVKMLVEVGKASTMLKNRQGKTALHCKQEELNELMQDEDEDDTADAESLKQQIQYLSGLA